MSGPTEMVSRSINIDIFEQMTKTLSRSKVLLHLDFELRYLIRLSLELSIQLEEIGEPFRKIFISGFDVLLEGLLVVSVEFN